MLSGCDRTVCSLAYFKHINVVFLWTVIWLLESANGGAGAYACAIDCHLHAVHKVQTALELGNCLIAAGEGVCGTDTILQLQISDSS